MASTVDIILSAKDEASGAIGRVSDALGGLGSLAAGAVTVGLAAAAAGFVALGTATAFSIAQALGNEKIQASLAQAIKASGGAAGITAEAANELAQSFTHLAGGSDDAILAITTIGIRAGTISSQEMPAFIQATLDLGAVMGDTSMAATVLARAQEDPIAALGRLQRAGIVFTDALKDQIKELAKNNDMAGATALIMDRVAEATGGAAAANAATLAGQWEILKGRLGEAAESIGMVLLPVLHDFFDNVIAPAIPIMETITASIGSFLETFASGDFEDPIGNLANLFYEVANALGLDGAGVFGAVIQLREPFETFVAAVQNAISVVAANLPLIWAAFQNTASEVQASGQSIMAAIQPIITSAMKVADAFMESMPMIMQSVGEMVAFVMEQINILSPTLIANVSETLNQIALFWREHGAEIMAIVTVAFQFITVTVGGALTLISGILASALVNMNGMFEVWAALARGDWQGAWDAIADTQDVAASIMEETLTAFMNSVLSIVGTNLDEFTAVWSTNWDNAVLIVTTVWDIMTTAIADKLMALTGNIQAAIIDIVNWLREYVPQFVIVGTNLIMGLINGVRSKAGELVEAVLGPVRDAINAVRNLLDSRSPSRVFADIGESIGQGLAQGIRDSTDLVAEAVHDMIEAGMVFSGLGGAAANLFKDRTVNPLRDTVRSIETVIDDMTENLGDMTDSLGEELGGEELEVLMRLLRLPPNIIDPEVARFQFTPEQIAAGRELVELQDQIAARTRERTEAAERLAEAEARLLELQQQQQDLQFLQQQVRLLDLIAEHGLDASTILGGLELGVNASLTGVIDAMTAALREIVAQTQEELGIHSPSSVFANFGRNLMEGLGLGISGGARLPAMAMAGAVTNIYNTVNAQYAYQPEGTVAKELALMSRLNR